MGEAYTSPLFLIMYSDEKRSGVMDFPSYHRCKMITVIRDSILTSEDATRSFQKLLSDFMGAHGAASLEDVSESLQISTDWELVITCEYHDHLLEVHIPNDDWVPSNNI